MEHKHTCPKCGDRSSCRVPFCEGLPDEGAAAIECEQCDPEPYAAARARNAPYRMLAQLIDRVFTVRGDDNIPQGPNSPGRVLTIRRDRETQEGGL